MALPVNRPNDEIVLTARMADVAAATVAYVVAPCKGRIKRAYSVIETTVDATDSIHSFAIDGATALTDTLTIAGDSTAGTVDSVTFSQVNTTAGLCNVNEGSAISVTSNAGGSTTSVANFFIVIEKI
jgi:hypothetical protein